MLQFVLLQLQLDKLLNADLQPSLTAFIAEIARYLGGHALVEFLVKD